MGNRRMASRRLPSFPLPFSCRSIFHRLHDTVSTCNGIPHLSKALQRGLHNEELPNSQKDRQAEFWLALPAPLSDSPVY